MKEYSPYQLINLADRLGYKVFQGGPDYHLNIWGIRSEDLQENTFNDQINVFWRDPENDEWNIVRFAATTDPGTYWRLNPINKMGTAVLKPGQYIHSWKPGVHKGYPALAQCKPIVVYRDNNENNIMDINGPGVTEDAGLFGINIHRANENHRSINVDKWSAGCQVLQNRPNEHIHRQKVFEGDWDYFMYLVTKFVENFGQHISYTLINEVNLTK